VRVWEWVGGTLLSSYYTHQPWNQEFSQVVLRSYSAEGKHELAMLIKPHPSRTACHWENKNRYQYLPVPTWGPQEIHQRSYSSRKLLIIKPSSKSYTFRELWLWAPPYSMLSKRIQVSRASEDLWLTTLHPQLEWHSHTNNYKTVWVCSLGPILSTTWVHTTHNLGFAPRLVYRPSFEPHIRAHKLVIMHETTGSLAWLCRNLFLWKNKFLQSHVYQSLKCDG
jgi:hypothetical protein